MTPLPYRRRTGPLTPALRRYMLAKGWIDNRTCIRLQRPDPAHVALLYRLREIEAAPEPSVTVEA